jgi:membrane-associated phospholipid phosphatase
MFAIGYQILFFLPVLFLVGWSRIKLKCHTITEVIAGAIFGFVSVYLQLIILL